MCQQNPVFLYTFFLGDKSALLIGRKHEGERNFSCSFVLLNSYFPRKRTYFSESRLE
jgi:hypothetical protein